MKKTIYSLIFTFLLSLGISAQTELITVTSGVKIKNNNQAEADYYFENNWKVLRERAIKDGYIHSFEIIETNAEKNSDLDLILITRYSNKEQYDKSEENFQKLIKKLIAGTGGLKLKNELKPGDFREYVFTKTGTSRLFMKYVCKRN